MYLIIFVLQENPLGPMSFITPLSYTTVAYSQPRNLSPMTGDKSALAIAMV